MPHKEYLFTSERLGFRNWLTEDYLSLVEINADPLVMEFFPALQTEIETLEFIARMKHQFKDKGYCYFAVDKLEDGEFIGFIGLSEPSFIADFTPCVDMGWRLRASEWHKGYATEGAGSCLSYAFDTLQLEQVYAIAPLVNQRSKQVMKKIGMAWLRDFKHPKLANDKRLEDCVLYIATNTK